MKKLILSFVVVALATTALAENKPEMMSWDDAYAKATEVLKTLSLNEKIEMTRLSLENGSAPVAIPDFTRGGWNKVQGYRHAFID